MVLINEELKRIRRAVNSVVITILGKKTSKTKPWFSRICKEAIKRRRVARRNWLNYTNNETLFNRYITRQREAINVLRCEKKKYLRVMIEKAELDY